MSSGSPTAYLLWAILSCLFAGFLVFHLWSYDRFQCLRWNSGRQPGAFKRVMTYTYVANMPLLVFFSVAMTVLKYQEGFSAGPEGLIIPKMTPLWQPSHQHLLLPLYFVLSGAWALELITHLEELTFWLFMLHQGPVKRAWFDSWEVRVWYIGCIVAGLGMPLTTLVSRTNIDECEAWVFLVGSSASTSTTLLFLYVLARFPVFIRYVKHEGADPDVVIRLTTFYNLNLVRVMFRFLFTLPLLALGIDGVLGGRRINSDIFRSDFLLAVGGIGCFISSAITLLIFFPRSITREAGYRAKRPSTSANSKAPEPELPSQPRMFSAPMSPSGSYHRYYHNQNQPSSHISSPRLPPSPGTNTALSLAAFRYPLPVPPDEEAPTPDYASEDPEVKSIDHGSETQDAANQDMALSDSSHAHHRIATAKSSPPRPRPPQSHLENLSLYSDLHPYVMTFTSPIDLLDLSDDGHIRGV